MPSTRSSSFSRRHVLTAGAAALAAPSLSWAQASYPTHPVTLTHGFGAGGNADVVARLIAQKLSESLKQPVVVDIKSGAGGVIASNAVAKAAPDGYNLVMLTGAHTVSAALKKKLPYDPVKDFSFISTVSAFPFVVAVRAEHPAKTLAELLEMAKKEPGRITFTSVGVGSTQHMVGELLGSTANVQLMHVPYRGGGAPVQAVPRHRAGRHARPCCARRHRPVRQPRSQNVPALAVSAHLNHPNNQESKSCPARWCCHQSRANRGR